MKSRSLADVARAVGGMLLGDDDQVWSVAIDSRDVVAGGLFVAIAGTRVDGHRFVAEAFERGAAGVMVRDGFRVDGPAVHVRSTEAALMRLAADERDRFEGTVVGITGANGKTSTKDMTAAILAQTFRAHASPASFNNEIGVPMTLLGAPPDTEVIVAELGARHAGDVQALCETAKPQIAVVTNVGLAHMEIFGSWGTIVEAAAEPVEALPADGIAVLNADDPEVAAFAGRTDAAVVSFGRMSEADVRAEEVSIDRDGHASFEVVGGGGRERVRLAVAGEHMISNALAATAVGLQLGVTLEACVEALASVQPSRWRMETFETAEGLRVVNDAYNASPESVAAALKTARWMAREAHLIAVLGHMAELGAVAADEHDRVGELAARLRVDRLVTVGPEAKTIAVAGLREGIEPDHVASYDDVDDAVRDVREHAEPGDVVLVKASRVAGLERVAEALR